MQRAIQSAKATPGVPRATLALYHYHLGRTYYARGGTWLTDRRYAFTSLMEAGSVPWRGQSAAFIWLGHFQREVVRDEARALRCYEKAKQDRAL